MVWCYATCAIIAYTVGMAKIDRSLWLIYLTLFVNVFDIVIHVVSGQTEFLRITSNILIVTAAILLIFRNSYTMLFALALSLYIVLNALFVLMNGGIGLLGALLIAATVFSGLWILRRKSPGQAGKQSSTSHQG